MAGKRIIYYILAAFVAGNLLLIYIQYNSVKNINILIDGNEKVLAEIEVSNNLRELKRDIISSEARTGGGLYARDSFSQPDIEKKISKVQSELDNLQKISDDDTSVKYIDVLDTLVHKKLSAGKNLLAAIKLPVKDTAQLSMISNRAKELDDSIRAVTQIIESSRQKLLAKVTAAIDRSGKNALNLGNVLIAMVLLSGAVLFWFIISAIRRQNQMIYQLNISEKKERESAQVKEKFMANMSHEIRTPMNAILGFTNLLQRKNLDEEAKEYVQTIHKSGENLLAIINDILDLSKIEAGMMRIESAPFSIRGLLHSVETMFKAKAGEKQIVFFVEVDETIPDTLEGDATRLTQILVNLIGNSFKFTNKGNISVKITNEGMADGKMNTGITVTDTGIGIDKNKLQYIFERFQQAEDSVTRKFGGTGLGLSIVTDLVSLQNGTISVESEAGNGAAFRVMIPYKISAQYSGSTAPTENSIKTGTAFADRVILVVEDNAINQSLIKHFFKSWQLKFEIVNNGREAIDKLRTTKYDLILMDIQMPEMDGYTAAQIIRGELKLTTPVIAMTAHALTGEREKCISCGMDDYISKPMREDELYHLIARYVELNKTPAEKNNFKEKTTIVTYRYIDLQYMKEVSLGDTEYEKTVTGQFIEAIPDDLLAIEKAWQTNQINLLRQTAHNMKTSVSVMGLNEALQPYLDSFEYETMNEEIFRKNFLPLKSICDASLSEARNFYAAL
jgi:signal transduction histidine kinase/CheY-like chemotaxis protein